MLPSENTPTVKLTYGDLPLLFALINTDMVWLEQRSAPQPNTATCNAELQTDYFCLPYKYKEFDGIITFSLGADTGLTPNILNSSYIKDGLLGCYKTLCAYDSTLRVCPTHDIEDYDDWDLDAVLAAYFDDYIFFTGYNPDIGKWDDHWHPAILCNDTFCYAADGENFHAHELDLIADSYAEFGYSGITAWVAHKRNQEPLAKYRTEAYSKARVSISERLTV
jgi:hypothetical protein